MDYRVYSSMKEIECQDKRIHGEQAVYDLWIECFGDSVSYTDFYFKWKMKDNQVYTVFKDTKISSMLHLNPYTLSIKGKNIPANYIVGVATKEEDRRQGLMKLLLEKAMHQMDEQNMPFTYLMPAKEAIYLPFGFRIVYEQENIKQLIAGAKSDMESRRTDLIGFKEMEIFNLEPEDFKNIEKVVNFTNELLLKTQDIFVYRDSYYYQRLIHEMRSSKGEVMLVLYKGDIIGYIAYMRENDLQIAEAVYIPGRKEEFFLGAAKSLGEYSNDTKETHNSPTIMARILNWNTFITGMTAIKETSLVIGVHDSVIENNNGIYEVVFTPAKSEVRRSEKSPEVEGDISDITRLFFGQRVDGMISPSVKEKDIIFDKLNNINYYNHIFINDVV